MSVWLHSYAISDTLTEENVESLLNTDQFRILKSRKQSPAAYVGVINNEVLTAQENLKAKLLEAPYFASHSTGKAKRLICTYCFEGMHCFYF